MSYDGWEISSPISKPLVFANQFDPTYSHSHPHLDTEWKTQANTNLTVRQFTYLELFCVAFYPILWLKDDQVVVSNNESVKQNVRIDVWGPPAWWKYVDRGNFKYLNATYRIPSASNYWAYLEFFNTTESIAGDYSCAEVTSKNGIFSTTVVRLHVDTSVKESQMPKVLQAGFSDVQLSSEHSRTNTSFSFVYFAPTNGTIIKSYFVLPSRETIGAFSERYDISVQETLLIEEIRKCSLTLKHASSAYWGMYEFVVETQSENGTLIQDKRTFTFNSSAELMHEKIENYSGEKHAFHAYLLLGRTYDVYFFIPDLTFIEETEIQVYVRSPTDCEFRRVRADKAYEECGVLGVSHSVEAYTNTVIGIRIVLKTIKPCKISLSWRNGAKGPFELNFAVVTETNHDSQRSWPDSVRNPTAVIKTLHISVKSGEPILANKSLTLRCSVPVCDWYKIMWCKIVTNKTICSQGWTRREDVDIPKYEGFEPVDPTINVTYQRLDSITDVYDMKFLALTTNHTGIYFCGTYRPWLDTYNEYGGLTYNLTIKNPEAPTFEDGKDNVTQKEFKEKNKARSLLCKINGFPKPNVSWWRDETISLNDSSDTLSIREYGDYKCAAQNDFGRTFRKFQVRYDDTMIPLAIALPAVVVLILLAICARVWFKLRANARLFKEWAQMLKEPQDTIPLDEGIPLNYQTDILSYNPNFEINRDLFNMTKLVGQGKFGKVFKGELKLSTNGGGLVVAVKVPRDPTKIQQHQDLIAEFTIMTHIKKHVNVVSLIGACTSNSENMQSFVLTEFCEYGSLEDYLIKNWRNFDPSQTGSQSVEASLSNVDLLFDFAYQTANGMKHLALENIIHRDLALRNLLLTRDFVVKVSDFGMSRWHETKKSYHKWLSPTARVPIYWMALETLTIGGETSVYTEKSDVWSFGVVLWEMFSCENPYAVEGLDTFAKLVPWLKRGHRLAKPRIASQEMYNLMLDCWEESRDLRPNFRVCKSQLGQFLEDRSASLYSLVQQKVKESAPRSAETTTSSNTTSEVASDIDNTIATEQQFTTPEIPGTLECSPVMIFRSYPITEAASSHIEISLNQSPQPEPLQDDDEFGRSEKSETDLLVTQL